MKKVALIQRPGQTQTKRPVTCEWLLVSFVCLGAIIQVSPCTSSTGTTLIPEPTQGI